jgi:hypothetical protein
VVGKGVKMSGPSREDPVDGGTKLQADSIPEGAEIEVGGVVHKSFSGLAQGLAYLLALEKKQWSIDPLVFFRNPHETPGPRSPKEIGQNGLDPVVFLVPQEEDGTGILDKIGIEKILPLFPQERFGGLWTMLLDGRRFSHDKSRAKPCRQIRDKVFVPGIFERIGMMVEMEDVEGPVFGKMAEKKMKEQDGVPTPGDSHAPDGAIGGQEVMSKQKASERSVKGGERILQRRCHEDTSGKSRYRRRSGL